MKTRPSPTEVLIRWAFLVLVLATFGALFVTQRLKHVPPLVLSVRMNNFFSPYSRIHPVERISFKVKHGDDVTVTVIDAQGHAVATLWDDMALNAYHKLSLQWNGYTQAGALAPPGTYRIRIRLRRQDRTIVPARQFVLRSPGVIPLITSISGSEGTPAEGPAILPQPGGGPLTISFSGAGSAPKVTVYRTDVTPAKLVATLPVQPGATSVTWAGTGLPPGTYMVAIANAAGISTPPVLPPAPAPGVIVPGHPGITVRYVGVEPPSVATVAGTPVTFGVDARRAPYSWTIARVGATRPRGRGHGTAALLRLPAPNGDSGAYVLGVTSHGHATHALFAVQGLYTQRVLVVLPAITWLGENPADDDGDGLPNTLATGQSVRTQRIISGNGLPAEYTSELEPLLAFLDKHGLRYDITTDLALAQGTGPQLAGHGGALLAGSLRWTPPQLQAKLRAFVQGGGRVAILGTDSLLAGVTLSGDELSAPTSPAAADVFGTQLAPLAPGAGTITDYLDDIGLFDGGDGQFHGYDQFQATQYAGSLAASAVTSSGSAVIVASHVGRGLVIRTGVPALNLADPASAALLERTWELLSQ